MRVWVSWVNPGEVKKRTDWMGFGIGYPRVVPHSDGVGTIEEVGEGVSHSRVSERVWVGARRAEDPSALLPSTPPFPKRRPSPCPRRLISR